MASKSTRARKRTAPEIVLRNGQPAAVILDIEHYRELLERAEDAEDLKVLRAMRRRPVKFRRLDDFLKSYAPDA
ncbi:MAG: type II toxin-antitoxin system prevent-host-death family antitoxin [Candidatus Binatia bacterium]